MDYIILILATWRISSLFIEEHGPLEIFDRLRSKAGIYYDERNEAQADNEVGKLLCCVWCFSVWVGFVLSVGYFFLPQITWMLLPFALSAGAIMVNKWTQ